MNTEERIKEIIEDFPILTKAGKNILKLQLEALVLQANIEALEKSNENIN